MSVWIAAKISSLLALIASSNEVGRGPDPLRVRFPDTIVNLKPDRVVLAMISVAFI
jgi:hypothetical protein